MSRYFIGVITFLLLILVACTHKQPQIETGKLAFKGEDRLIMQSILQMNAKDFTQAKNTLNTLYEKTKKPIYQARIIGISYLQNELNTTISLSTEFLKKGYNERVEYILFMTYLKQNRLDTALAYIKEQLKTKRRESYYRYISYIYMQKQDYKQAIDYLKSAYSLKPSTTTVIELGNLLFRHLNKPNEAVSYYQTHIRLHGCDENVCTKLLGVYQSLYDTDNMVEVYKKLYQSTEKEFYKNKLLGLYLYHKQYDKAEAFIKQNRLGETLLQDLYKYKFQTEKNPTDALKLFKSTDDIYYLKMYAVYTFENSKQTKEDALKALKVLDQVLQKESTSPIYNYAGYLRIKYDLDVTKGIELVKKALEKDPLNEAYLDSLAWGYYKQNRCQKAYEIIKGLKIEDKEVDEHKIKIKRCIDDLRKNSKQNKGTSPNKNQTDK